MIYRGYDIQVPFPPGSGNIKIVRKGEVVQEFTYATDDEVLFDWIDKERRRRVAAGLGA